MHATCEDYVLNDFAQLLKENKNKNFYRVQSIIKREKMLFTNYFRSILLYHSTIYFKITKELSKLMHTYSKEKTSISINLIIDKNIDLRKNMIE